MKTKPAFVVEFLKARADAKRARRASKPGAGAYAKRNCSRK